MSNKRSSKHTLKITKKTPCRIVFTCLVIMVLTITGNSFPKRVQAQNVSDLPQLSLPVACTLGKTCWTINYVDTDPSPDNAKDFTCSHKITEGHKGTDFAIRSRNEMFEGVDVLAAADGKVIRMRDGEDDAPKTYEQYQAIRKANKDCGNGVIIDHGNNLQAYYCHLKQGSITVNIDDTVKTGQKIGQIGQSGFSEFPHLHFTIVWNGQHIDPFTGQSKDDGCGLFKNNRPVAKVA